MCYQKIDCSTLVFSFRNVLIMRKNCSSDRGKISKSFEITRMINSNSERSEQVLVTESFLTCSWRFVRYDELEQLEFKLEKNIRIEKRAAKVRIFITRYVFISSGKQL